MRKKNIAIRLLGAGVAIAGVCIVSGSAQTEKRRISEYTLDDLLPRLSERPLSNSVPLFIERQPPDPRTLPALRAAFEAVETKREKQDVAASLIRLGEKSDRYFEFLAGFAREAVTDRTPSFAKYDAQGHTVRGEFSAEFENWCALYHKNPREVAAVQFGTYMEDLWTLAKVDDPRSLDIFRAGLDSPNTIVVADCVMGLARLQDVSSIKLIAKAAARLPSGDRSAVAMYLPYYSGPDAEQLFEQLEPDRSKRDSWRDMILRTRVGEMEVVRDRARETAK